MQQAAVNYILEKYGYPTRALEEVRRFVGNGAGPLIHRALPQGVDLDREAEILAYRAHYQAHNCGRLVPMTASGRCWSGCGRQACGRRWCPISRTGPPGPWRPGSSRSWTGPWASGRASPPSPPPGYGPGGSDQLHAAPEETLYVGATARWTWPPPGTLAGYDRRAWGSGAGRLLPQARPCGGHPGAAADMRCNDPKSRNEVQYAYIYGAPLAGAGKLVGD